MEQIVNKSQMIDYIAKGCKPQSAWRIGTEHEKIGFSLANLKPLSYEGATSILAMLEGLRDQFDWQEVREDGYLIALKRAGASISLEPGGQFELSGAPLASVHETCGEVNLHLREVKTIADKIGAGFLSLGFRPDTKLEDVPIMPKARYQIMRDYMPKVGMMGREMMFRTCTVQTNLDFSSEHDMVKKMRVSLALQPVATALFANSPFLEGSLNGYKSYRSLAWLHTDNDRTGMLDFAFEEGFGFEHYVDYALDVPMYFVKRADEYKDASGLDFKDFLQGKLAILPSELPSLSDFEDHLSTIFPEVRLKQFLEMRGADTGPWSLLCALPALWVGLLYTQDALDSAWDLVKAWTAEERWQLRKDVPKQGLEAQIRGRSVRDLAGEVLGIARGGLKARALTNAHGETESVFLGDLDEIIRSGRTPADILLEKYHNDWQGDVSHAYKECIY